MVLRFDARIDGDSFPHEDSERLGRSLTSETRTTHTQSSDHRLKLQITDRLNWLDLLADHF